MEERLQKMEKFQEQVTQDMKNLRDNLEKSQENLMSKIEDKLTQLLSKATNSGKGKVQEIPEEDSSSLPRKPQETGPRFVFSAGGLQSNVHNPTNLPGASDSNMWASPTKMDVSNFNDPIELEKLKEEQFKDFGTTNDKFKYLEERIKAMEGTNAFIGTNAMELSLVPDLILPPNFKVLEFEKFDGTSCPNVHLTMLCRKMTGYENDEKLLIHFFQDSLTGSAMRWYNQLRKKDKESLHEYAQRWRDIAAQVQPPLIEKETKTLFINSLESTPMYYARLVGSTTRDFADLVTTGEAIELAIKSGKLNDPEASKKTHNKRRETEVNMKEGGPEKPPPRLVIKAPSPFSYKNSHQVPWIYGCNMTAPRREVSEIEIAGISGVGNFTRSGRCHPLDISKSMEIKDADQKDKFPFDLGIPEINEPVREEDAHEFLKFIKHSEYSVVEQLHKQPACILVLTLLLSSEPHRNALLKVLNQTFVPNDVLVDKLDRLVNNLHVDNFISFSEDEIPVEGTSSVKALHITTHCHGHILPHVNGSALNVMPMSTLNRLQVDKAHIRPCHTSVRAFDGTRREVVGKIDVPLLIGPATYNVEFTVMYITPAYNCTEEDIIASTSTDAPYINVDENAIECTFRSLEFVNATFVVERKKIPEHRLSKKTLMGVRLTVGKGARSEKGLGKSLQGMHTSLQPILKYDRSGVGYKPNPRQRMKKILRMREQRRARLIGQSIEKEPMQFPRISETFVSGGHIHSKGEKRGNFGDAVRNDS
ncbi:hypothetical protein GQ457_13G018330 [Hibiscus cannabinus]